MERLLPCLFLTAIVAIQCVFGARILAVLPMPSRSHHNMFHAVLKTLAERGHQVINYSPYPLNQPVPNYTDVHLKSVVPAEKFLTKEFLARYMDLSPVGAAKILWTQAVNTMHTTYEDKRLKELLDSNEQFDLVILEALFAQEALLGFGHKFKAPIVNLHPFNTFSVVNKVSGNALSLAYIPDFAFISSDHMTFYERFLNAYSILSSLYYYYNHYLPAEEEYIRKMFKDPTMPSLMDMVYNISLFVNNIHPNIQYSQPYTPNQVSIGGIHLSKKHESLPPTVKKFLDEAEHGVIYFSLGSVIPDDLLGQEFFDNFINVFRKLPQRVLWKTSFEPKNLPDNIITLKWVPQQDVLAHPNIVLFITHGGLFSQQEAIHAGVPVVCIPFFWDQPFNAKFYEERQIGVRLLFNTLSQETIFSALTTVLNNQKYKENMLKLSLIYRDLLLSPADNLVFWVEYILRHKGSQHLTPASTSLSWYQLALLDILATIVALFVVVVVILYLVIKKVFNFVRGNNPKKGELFTDWKTKKNS